MRLSKSVVIDGVRKIAAQGHLKIEAGRAGRGHSTHYWMIEKGRCADLSDQKKGRMDGPTKGRPSARKGRPADLTLSKTHRIPGGSIEPPREEERESDVLAHVDFDLPGDAVAPGGARVEEEEGRKGPPAKKEKDAFAMLRAVWPRPWLDDERADREAFAKACREVTPEAIIEAATAWAQAADAPRFLPVLAKWLAARGWEKPPPEARRRQKMEARGQHRNGRKVDLAKLALKMGGYVENDDGSMVWGGMKAPTYEKKKQIAQEKSQ